MRMNDKLSYEVIFINTRLKGLNESYGSLVWEDGVHIVNSPIAIIWIMSSQFTLSMYAEKGL